MPVGRSHETGDPEARIDGAAAADRERGRACYEQRRWSDAYEALSRVDEAGALEWEDLERLAWSAALTGREEQLFASLERLYHAHLEAGRDAAAARAAFWLGFRLYALGEPGRAGGWLARAQRAVECEGGDCPERGYLMLPVVARHLGMGNDDAAHDAAVEAATIGDRFGERDLSAVARDMQARALLRRGQVPEGLALIDEVMISAASGELSPLVTGLLYCSVIASCQRVYALDRAREWTSALASWCEQQPQLVTFTAACLVHRAEILELEGAWGQATEEARRVSDDIGGTGDPDAVGNAHYQQAEVHRLRGEVEAAEEAYRKASQHGREPQPGLALLRLAQGRGDTALAALRRVLGSTEPPLQRARFLPAMIEIALESNEIDEASRAAGELEEIASRFRMEVLGAMAAHGRGAVLLATGEAQAAIEPLRHALRIWRQVGAPYIAARIRVLVGRACHALGDEDGFRLELDAARQVFDELGAAPDVARLDALEAGRSTGERSHGLTPRELEVLRLVAAGMTNKGIARELCVSERTVDRHVSNIFTKLDVPTRSAATAFAYENRLL